LKTHLEKNYQNKKFEVKLTNKTISIGTDSLEMYVEMIRGRLIHYLEFHLASDFGSIIQQPLILGISLN
jgi:hypothetical protein